MPPPIRPRPRLLLAALLLSAAGALRAQVDGNIWLTAAGGVAPGAVIELTTAGSVAGVYPGPLVGSSGVAKDLFLERVWVCDDQAPNAISSTPGMVRLYRSGVGLAASYAAPGIRGLAVLGNGDLAALLSRSVWLPAEVQILPSVGTPPPPPSTVGYGAVQIRAGRDQTCWTLNQVSGTVSRIQNGLVAHIPVNLPGTLSAIETLPSGGLVVTASGVASAVILDSAGAFQDTVNLPEPPLRVAADGDEALCMLGASGTFFRIHTPSQQLIESWPLGAGPFGSLLAGPRATVWIERHGPNPRVEAYGRGGALIVSTPLPAATRTFGDPLGIEHAWKADPDGDNDADGITNREEYRRGTDPSDDASIPPLLSLAPHPQAPFAISLEAPGADGLIFVILVSLSGSTPPLSLSIDGISAPYCDLVIFEDVLAAEMVQSQPWVSAMFPGMPLSVVGPGGQIVFPVTLHPVLQALGSGVTFSCSGAIIDSNLTTVRATTKTLFFDALGTPLP